jgi:hypothetical protein
MNYEKLAELINTGEVNLENIEEEIKKFTKNLHQ